ncbi:ATP-grasp domain-containing protein [Halocynthiibacter namhaensis]|uniref:ATP-grasp domain-containing protein n=1 Tax=Halocynthiibacter namhaensis TaxID=1290553 RepID=UPI00068BA222|nr:hypothetical protein [Halocynthiibacter namhaensis]
MEPQERIGVARLTKLAFNGADLGPLRAQLLSRCILEGNAEGAFMDLSVIEQLLGNSHAGLEWQAQALKTRRVYSSNSEAPNSQIDSQIDSDINGQIDAQFSEQQKLLVFAATGPMGWNTPVEFLLQGSNYQIITYFPDFDAPHPAALPDHDIAICAAPTDSAASQHFIENLRQLTQKTGAKTLNLPTATVNLDRDALSQAVPKTPSLRFPNTTRHSRKQLKSLLDSEQESQILNPLGQYPYIIRPCGSHAGIGLAKFGDRDALIAYLDTHQDQEFFISEFINYASQSDGAFRKYRIVFVDGKAFPCHMAISDQWDLWYMNAKMEGSAHKKAQEARFMDRFERDFDLRHQQAFSTLTQEITLDYFGIDCAEDRDGNLVVFEADNALIVHDMDSNAVFPYKNRHMHRIFAAFRAMLDRHATPLAKPLNPGSDKPAPSQNPKQTSTDKDHDKTNAPSAFPDQIPRPRPRIDIREPA